MNTTRRILLTGQPNCGKSTFFNSLTGYKALTANFPGATVSYQSGSLILDKNLYEILDLPGTYSLIPHDRAELETKKFIIHEANPHIVNVVDASVLSRSLELTIELIEQGKPTVVALNMVDTAHRKGLSIDSEKLSELLGVPVVDTIANKGKGVVDVIKLTSECTEPNHSFNYQKDVEQVIETLSQALPEAFIKSFTVPVRTLSIRLLENDRYYIKELERLDIKQLEYVRTLQNQLEDSHGRKSDLVIAAERHHLAMKIFEDVTTFTKTKEPFETKLDQFFLHPVFGYIILAAVMYIVFTLIFKTGAFFEGIILDQFDSLGLSIKHSIETPFLSLLINGIVQGVGAGIGIAVPFIIPFLIALSILEDTGYMARIAFLADNVMHKIGLHGKAVIAFVLGYGCSVPAVMAARNLETRRDQIVTATLSIFIPCSAKSIVIFGLVGFYMGIKFAVGIYLLNILVIGIIGRIITKVDKTVSPGLVLEIPHYHLPSLKNIFSKTWIRIKDFFTVVIPFLIAGTVLLSFLEYYNADTFLNTLLSPLTVTVLGLPEEVGTLLIFGIMKKELTLIMLFQALHTTVVTDVMTLNQILTFTVFVVFYIPCISTIAVLKRETGLLNTAIITFGSLALATLLAIAVRLLALILL